VPFVELAALYFGSRCSATHGVPRTVDAIPRIEIDDPILSKITVVAVLDAWRVDYTGETQMKYGLRIFVRFTDPEERFIEGDDKVSLSTIVSNTFRSGAD
jgi:hypothetical protein